MGQEVRDAVGTLLLQLTLKELFQWRFMQTDPNWGQLPVRRAHPACSTSLTSVGSPACFGPWSCPALWCQAATLALAHALLPRLC